MDDYTGNSTGIIVGINYDSFCGGLWCDHGWNSDVFLYSLHSEGNKGKLILERR